MCATIFAATIFHSTIIFKRSFSYDLCPTARFPLSF
jgi:hypothetical protein